MVILCIKYYIYFSIIFQLIFKIYIISLNEDCLIDHVRGEEDGVMFILLNFGIYNKNNSSDCKNSKNNSSDCHFDYHI